MLVAGETDGSGRSRPILFDPTAYKIETELF